MRNEIAVCENPVLRNQISFEEREKELQRQKQQEEQELKRNKNSPFTRFYQVNKEHSEDLQWLLKNNVIAYRLLLFLLDHMDAYNAVMVSYKALQEYFQVSRVTLSNAVKVLKDHGFIYVYKSGTSNVYVTNPNIAWNSWGNNVQYCKFPANIILSASEQQDRQRAREFKPNKINTVDNEKK